MRLEELKKSLWGYRKETVLQYVVAQEEAFSKRLLEKDGQAAEADRQARARIEALEAENRELRGELERLRGLQEQISAEYLRSFVGKQVEVLCDGIDYDRKCFVGRAWWSAPDIDGKVYFHATEAEQGERCLVTVTGSDSYDLFGETEEYHESAK